MRQARKLGTMAAAAAACIMLAGSPAAATTVGTDVTGGSVGADLPDLSPKGINDNGAVVPTAVSTDGGETVRLVYECSAYSGPTATSVSYRDFAGEGCWLEAQTAGRGTPNDFADDEWEFVQKARAVSRPGFANVSATVTDPLLAGRKLRACWVVSVQFEDGDFHQADGCSYGDSGTDASVSF